MNERAMLEKALSIKIGSQVKVMCNDNSIHTGTVADVRLGMDKENPWRISIILSETELDAMICENTNIWYDDVRNIEPIHDQEDFPFGIAMESPNDECQCMNEDWISSVSNLSCRSSDIAWKSFWIATAAIAISVLSLIMAFV